MGTGFCLSMGTTRPPRRTGTTPPRAPPTCRRTRSGTPGEAHPGFCLSMFTTGVTHMPRERRGRLGPAPPPRTDINSPGVTPLSLLSLLSRRWRGTQRHTGERFRRRWRTGSGSGTTHPGFCLSMGTTCPLWGRTGTTRRTPCRTGTDRGGRMRMSRRCPHPRRSTRTAEGGTRTSRATPTPTAHHPRPPRIKRHTGHRPRPPVSDPRTKRHAAHQRARRRSGIRASGGTGPHHARATLMRPGETSVHSRETGAHSAPAPHTLTPNTRTTPPPHPPPSPC
ncbi:hypothetical protein T484DRAFT_3024592 [Baffinella frigidus]|nr:hypothetical protein T484DRAFT_3024592 [Cryptophyta sp. CCMP2293]